MQMLRLVKMSSDSAISRIGILSSALSGKPTPYLLVRFCSETGGDKFVNIGGASIEVKEPKNIEYVPVKYVQEELPQSMLKHLRWLIQKDVLGQDMFLIGPPGPMRRNLAMMYSEMTKKEVEYISLSRDTTETDLKQRREIKSGTAFHVDQCAVRAATEGRMLILEGIEKAERNVLPVLNNLLENREMQLDDGRFLMSATRYDQLLKDHTKEELDAWKLVRVSEDFRVIALGLPVPKYQGNPLDPPLRSRFQARDIDPLPFKDQLAILQAVAQGVSPDKLSRILSFANTLKTEEATTTLGLPDFPLDHMSHVVKILSAVPSVPTEQLLEKLYPYNAMLGKEGITAVRDTLKRFQLSNPKATNGMAVSKVQKTDHEAVVQIASDHAAHNITVKGGTLLGGQAEDTFVYTSMHDQLLSDMMMSHYVTDFCIIGPRGCGKSMVAKKFADMLGYNTETIMLYQDMTWRDLVQQRMTLPNGDTAWRPSPLVNAALNGSLAVLDGVHRINAGTFSVLHRLIHDRELTLFDGTRLMSEDRYDTIKTSQNLTDENMKEKKLLCIHPSFRMMALAEPPVVGSSGQQWLNSEMLTMFLYHHMRELSQTEELYILKQLVPHISDMKPLMDLVHQLRHAHDINLKAVATSLSTRQLLRIARRRSSYPGEDMYSTVQKACLGRFLPRLARTALDETLEDLGINKPSSASVQNLEKALSCDVTEGVLRIGDTKVNVFNPDTLTKVPDVLFYDNPQHLHVMEDMLKDFLLGEHLLLVGNQGVGKNKIVDRFLHLLSRPREYIQLHRDTTVQTLTLQPTVQDGVIIYEDSPLVNAVKQGHVLVVDEADKAPTNVTCILKTLVESSEMHLSDGRRIVSAHSGLPDSPSIIRCHPDFRMIVLANRPGFPFLGNDFFGAMGDIFSCHAVDNPNTEGEINMLKQYGPHVPHDTLHKLVTAFSELRDMADQGLINYPYSTREVVNMVKHLEKYPDEGLAQVVRNVFDFDSYNSELKETIVTTLHKNGIPVGADPRNVNLAKLLPLPKIERMGEWDISAYATRGGTGPSLCPVEDKHITIKGPVQAPLQTFALDRTEARGLAFSEQEAFWTIPLHETSVISDVAVTKGKMRQPGQINDDVIHIGTINPVSVYSMPQRGPNVTCIDLYDVFPYNRNYSQKPRLNIAPLGFPLDSNIVVHEELTNALLDINWETGEVRRLDLSGFLESVTKNFRQSQGVFKMCGDFAHDQGGLILLYKQEGKNIDVVHMLEGRAHSISVPIRLLSINMLSKYDWLLTDTENQKFILESSESNPFDYRLRPIVEQVTGELLSDIQVASQVDLHKTLISAAVGTQLDGSNRVFSNESSHAVFAVGLPEQSYVELHHIPRAKTEDESAFNKRMQYYGSERTVKKIRANDAVKYLPDSGQVVRVVPDWQVPKEVFPEGKYIGVSTRSKDVSGYLEVTDAVNKTLRYIPVPGVEGHNAHHQWYTAGSDVKIVLGDMSNDGLVTVDTGGCIRLWETALMHLDQSMTKWRSMIGDADDKNLQITTEKEVGKEAEAPKHGRVDPDNAPHVGGNQWAGGTGGRDTAGLGGIGGPYRLDAGHDVTQVTQADKDAVPEEVKQAARAMGQKAYKERLKQIEMSEFDGALYEQYAKSVRSQVKSLRVILDNLQRKGKEREWLKHQTYGDLDDAKLIEGLTGEKAIYRRRGEKEPELGSPQQKPKLIRILCDVSGSMYRFNGHDGRMDRQLEAMLMVMEAFENYEHKVKFEIRGHSGEGHNFKMMKEEHPPKNPKQRLDILKSLHAHSQFCISGDHTLEATEHAIKTIGDEEADEHFVIVLSDANFERYGIRPRRFAEVLSSNDDVNAYVIFIGSIGDQAHRLMKQLPSGKAFLCMDTKNLPNILQQIFTSTMLKTN